MWRRRYEISVAGHSVATWDSATWSGGGSFGLNGQTYQVRTNIWGSRYALLDAVGRTVASADRVGRKHWSVAADGRTYTFQRVSIWSNDQELYAGGRPVGWVTGSWRGDLAANLPGLPLLVQIFVLGVVISVRERAKAA